MNGEQQRNRLNLPLPPLLLSYIKHDYPDLCSFIVSTVETTVRESKNHYFDVMRALEPHLKENTKAFVDKLFMFRKKMCKDGENCARPLCLFAHNDEELSGVKKSVAQDSTASYSVKRTKTESTEIIIDDFDELKYTFNNLRDYLLSFGKISSLRRISKNRYVVTFDEQESALDMISSKESVMGDSTIKKFFNLNLSIDQNKKIDLAVLFEEQKRLMDKLNDYFDPSILEKLDTVMLKIRSIVLPIPADKKSDESVVMNSEKKDDEIESSLYYNMFAE